MLRLIPHSGDKTFTQVIIWVLSKLMCVFLLSLYLAGVIWCDFGCLQFDCGGMVLEEQPDKMSESFRLFLQGMGYGEFLV